jgi:hypothetical protein
MRQAVFEQIKTDDNPIRLHANNGSRSPIDFEIDFKHPLLFELSVFDDGNYGVTANISPNEVVVNI